jgi:hypothetical protein
MRSRHAAMYAATALVALGGLAAWPAGAVSTSATPVFGVPRIVDPIHAYGEPDLAGNRQPALDLERLPRRW